MTTELAAWLQQATRHLAKASAAQVRAEIQEHYESAHEAAMSAGESAQQANRSAVTALGDAKTANRHYRRVLLTPAEARLLREDNWGVRVVCSQPWLKRLLAAIPVVALFAAAAYFLAGETFPARMLLAGGIAMGLTFAAPLLPLYTPSRGRAFRIVKCAGLTVVLGLALQWSWLLVVCLWPLAWTEWKRASIRRKLPVARWPRQLYL